MRNATPDNCIRISKKKSLSLISQSLTVAIN